MTRTNVIGSIGLVAAISLVPVVYAGGLWWIIPLTVSMIALVYLRHGGV